MLMSEVVTYSQQLFDQLGPRAIAVAAQRAVDCSVRGDEIAARDWRRIEGVLKEKRGPRET